MNPPVDYPVHDDGVTRSASGPMTYAALMARHAAAEPITEDMIQSATLAMEAAQQLPNAAKAMPIERRVAAPARSEEILARLLKVIR